MVPIASIVFILLDMLLGILIPLWLMLFLRKRYGLSLRAFAIGCITMVVFALLLERIAHSLILGSSLGATIKASPLLYALYGGLMAGLFEETGRLIAMRYALKGAHDRPRTALMYGAGHGGFECFYLLFLGMINSLLYSVYLNTGHADVLLAPLDEAGRQLLESAFEALRTTAPALFLLSPVERIAALCAQLALSVIVWRAACGKRIRPGFYLLAVALHMALDTGALCLQQLGLPALPLELAVCLMAAGIALIARRLRVPAE